MNKDEKIEWARRETWYFNEGETPDVVMACDIAFLAFHDFLERINESSYPGISQAIFLQLLNEEPLTPIVDNDEDWKVVETIGTIRDNGVVVSNSIYQCKRRESLFKKITNNEDGTEMVEFSDTKRYICIDINTKQSYTGGIGALMLDKLVPITMPYEPGNKIRIFTESFKYHKDGPEEADTIGILYAQLNDGAMIKVKKFFKNSPETMIEMEKSEYMFRRNKAIEEGRLVSK